MPHKHDGERSTRSAATNRSGVVQRSGHPPLKRWMGVRFPPPEPGLLARFRTGDPRWRASIPTSFRRRPRVRSSRVGPRGHRKAHTWVWLNLAERSLRERETGGSNPPSQTIRGTGRTGLVLTRRCAGFDSPAADRGSRPLGLGPDLR